jgi:subtilase family serine protease
VPALEHDGESRDSMDVALPADLTAGTWYLIAAADHENAVAEFRETNNTRARTLKIGPDLVVSSVSAPSSAAPGASVIVGAVVTNLGTPAAVTTLALYLSTDKTLGGDDVLLGTVTVPALGPGATYDAAIAVTIPGATPVGSYYYLARADDADVVEELTETNNTRTRAVTVALPAAPKTKAGTRPPPAGLSRP